MSKCPKCWMKVFGRKSEWAASTCACSPSATRWACKRRFTTSTQNLDCSFRARRGHRTGQRKSGGSSRGSPKANRQLGTTHIGVEAIAFSIDQVLWMWEVAHSAMLVEMSVYRHHRRRTREEEKGGAERPNRSGRARQP